jgi:hypothetical protein
MGVRCCLGTRGLGRRPQSGLKTARCTRRALLGISCRRPPAQPPAAHLGTALAPRGRGRPGRANPTAGPLRIGSRQGTSIKQRGVGRRRRGLRWDNAAIITMPFGSGRCSLAVLAATATVATVGARHILESSQAVSTSGQQPGSTLLGAEPTAAEQPHVRSGYARGLCPQLPG